jgi:hypothetical protein
MDKSFITFRDFLSLPMKVETAVLGTHVVGDFGTGTSADTSVRPKVYKHIY